MGIEASLLAWSVVLGLVHIAAAAGPSLLRRGTRWAVSARDTPGAELGVVGQRLRRAQDNFLETFPLFAAAVLLALLTGAAGELTAWGAGLYFWGRVAYLPLYATGVPWLRSLAWTVAVAGIVLVLAALL